MASVQAIRFITLVRTPWLLYLAPSGVLLGMTDIEQVIEQAIETLNPGRYHVGDATIRLEPYQGRVYNRDTERFEHTGLLAVHVAYRGKTSSESLLAAFPSFTEHRPLNREESREYLRKLFVELA